MITYTEWHFLGLGCVVTSYAQGDYSVLGVLGLKISLRLVQGNCKDVAVGET